MLIPLRIDHDYEGPPYATWGLITANVVVHLLTMGMAEEKWLPYILDTNDFALYQLITGQFLHSGWAHLIGNMVFLHVYGRYVEARVGPVRFLGIYFLCAVAGDIAFTVAGGGRALGASGAIVGLMGFVVVAAPWIEVSILFWIYVFVRRFKMAAFWLIGWWLAWEIFYATMLGGAGVAHSAHFGGFAAGLAIAWLMRSKHAEGTSWYLEPGPYVTGVKSRFKRRATPPPAAAPRAPVAVVFQSIAEAPSRVAVIKLLMKAYLLEPEDADERLTRVASGSPQAFGFQTRPPAERFAARARELGVQTRIDVRRTVP